jgi:hypothetical protein
VDDILFVYNKQITDINNTLKQFNEIIPKLQFTIEIEKDNVIDFLDITIIKNPDNIQYSIYRKPATTDNIIHNTSCYPTEHKMLAMSYLIHRINTYPIQNKIEEENIIMTNNQYSEKIFHKINRNQKKKKDNFQNNNKDNNKEWATFTYIGRDTRRITKIFKTAYLKIAFKTTNTIQNNLCNLKEPNHRRHPYKKVEYTN